MIDKNQSGRTMLEMLGVLAIMGIIIYGAISGINYGMTSYKVNQMYIEIGNISNDIQDMYLAVFGRNNFPNITCDMNSPSSSDCQGLIKNGILNKNLKGLSIQVTDNHDLTIIYTMPNTDSGKDICERLKEMDWDVQSINVSGDCVSSPYTLTFQPK